MGKINVLGFDVANLIAAGEVVDRPASIVKELIENAVDSGATAITVEIKRGGISHIRVSDNGCGIDYDDLPLCVLRHATSKIKDASDLEYIGTLGFRGEALAAIAAVTKLKIYTKPEGNENGSLMVCEGGEIVDVCETGCAKGTTVIADELFYNVPARRKFLKRDATECAKITEIVERVALSVPSIAIKYVCDGQIRFMTQGDGNLKNTIHSVFGKATASRLIPVSRTENGVTVKGYVSDSDMNFSKRSQEIFYVNGRYVKSPMLMASLERAYVSKIPSDKFPMCVLNVEVSLNAVDVNVHPTKLEVKFSNERVVSEALHYAVLTALNSSDNRPEMKLGSVYASNGPVIADYNSQRKIDKVVNAFVPVEKQEKDQQLSFDTPTTPVSSVIKPKEEVQVVMSEETAVKIQKVHEANEDKPHTPAERSYSSIMAGYDIPDFSSIKKENNKNSITKDAVQEESTLQNEPVKKQDTLSVAPIVTTESKKSEKIPDFKIIGEAYNCYVMVELEDRILMIDKHAAHERILFDELCKRRKSKEKESQNLLVPIEVVLLRDDILILAEYSDDIKAVGFDYELETASLTVKITKIPSEIDTEDSADMFTTIIARLSEGTGTVESTESEFFEKALYQAACKAAIKGGRHYGIDHIKWLCTQLLKTPDDDGKVIKTCPHGRPVAFEIKKTSIERQFSRLE